MNHRSTPIGSYEERLLDELRAVVARRGTAQQQASTRHAGGGRPRRWRHLIAAGAVFAASGSLGGLALAGTFGQSIDPQAWLNGERVEPQTAISRNQSADLEILRRTRTAADALTRSDAQMLTASPAAANGANVALARRAQGLTSGAAWIVPGKETICFVFSDPPVGSGGTCQPTAAVTSGRWPIETAGSSSAPGLTVVAGVVPDGIARVTIKRAGRSTISVAVHENVYLTVMTGWPASVTYVHPGTPEKSAGAPSHRHPGS